MFEARDVVRVLTLLDEAGCEVWIGGGWGIDALVGRATRAHGDLDLMHRAPQEPMVVEALGRAGFAEMDAVPGRPARFVMVDADGLSLDLHPLHFQRGGAAVQYLDHAGARLDYPASCFTSGTIDGIPVPCLSAAQQVYFHQGYEPRQRDLHDMAMLRESFDIATYF